jgi:hypothetical protein
MQQLTKDISILERKIKLLKEIKDYKDRTKENYWVTTSEGLTVPRHEYYGIPLLIACAANNYGGLIITGIRHHSPDMSMTYRLIGKEIIDDWLTKTKSQVIQGFVDQYGMFYTREQAWIITRASNQIRIDRYNLRTNKSVKDYSELPEHDKLYSEDYL